MIYGMTVLRGGRSTDMSQQLPSIGTITSLSRHGEVAGRLTAALGSNGGYLMEADSCNASIGLSRSYTCGRYDGAAGRALSCYRRSCLAWCYWRGT